MYITTVLVNNERLRFVLDVALLCDKSSQVSILLVSLFGNYVIHDFARESEMSKQRALSILGRVPFLKAIGGDTIGDPF